MIRLAASICFFLTLLCPLVCLAGADDDCSDFGQAEGRNCEAMSVGAVIAKTVTPPAQFAGSLPATDHPALITTFYCDARRLMRLATWNRVISGHPPAATRRAMLQRFLI